MSEQACVKKRGVTTNRYGEESPLLRVQVPGAHSSEYQWEFETSDPMAGEWTEQEMAPIEQVLLLYVTADVSATWHFSKWLGLYGVTRPNWEFTAYIKQAEGPAGVARYVQTWYEALYGKGAKR